MACMMQNIHLVESGGCLQPKALNRTGKPRGGSALRWDIFIFSRATISYISFHWTRNKPYHFPPRWTTMSTARSPPSPAIPATPSMTPSLPLRWLHPHYFQPEFPALQTALTQLGGSQDELHLNIGKLEIPGISQNSNRMSSQESPGI